MSKLKRTLALLATLAMASTAFVACGGGDTESKEESKADNSAAESKDDAGAESEDAGTESEDAGDDTADLKLADDGDCLTIVCWTDTDLNNMFDVYTEKNADAVVGETIKYQNCGTNGGEASTQYATYLNSGDDVDLFVAEAGWILNYINDDSFAAPLSDLGITEADYADAYDYTVKIATDNNGVLKGASWQAAAGGFCYNTDIASEKLGITTPEDMQAAIGSWDGFKATAEQLKTATDGAVTMCATLGGLWQCFSTATGAAWVDGTTLNTTAVKDFTAMAKEMVDAGYVNPAIDQWTADWTNVGLNGETLGYFYSTWCLGAGAQLEQNGGTAGNWNIVVGPQEYFWGGSWLCVSPNCDNASMAADFIKTFTVDAATMEEYALYSGDFVNNKTAMNNIVSAGTNSNALLGGQDQFAVLADVAAGIDMSATISKYDQSLKDTYLPALRDNIDKSVDDVVAAYTSDALAANPDLSAE